MSEEWEKILIPLWRPGPLIFLLDPKTAGQSQGIGEFFALRLVLKMCILADDHVALADEVASD